MLTQLPLLALLCRRPAAAGAILFEETLFQDTRKGTSMVSELQKQVSRQAAHSLPEPEQPASGAPLCSSACVSASLPHLLPNPCPRPSPLTPQGLVPGIKVDKGLHPLANANGENWCAGLDGLAERCASYYAQGARFCKWRSTVSIPSGPTTIAVRDCAYGLARYAAIAQNAGLVSHGSPQHWAVEPAGGHQCVCVDFISSCSPACPACP